MQKLQVKTIDCIFYAKGITHDFVLQKHAINDKCYEEVIKRLMAWIHCIRPEVYESGPCYLLHCSAPAHSLGVFFEVLLS
jgi:hypothetical protein